MYFLPKVRRNVKKESFHISYYFVSYYIFRDTLCNKLSTKMINSIIVKERKQKKFVFKTLNKYLQLHCIKKQRCYIIPFLTFFIFLHRVIIISHYSLLFRDQRQFHLPNKGSARRIRWNAVTGGFCIFNKINFYVLTPST